MIDAQKCNFIDNSEVHSIDTMPGYKDRMIAAGDLVDAAVPVIFIQEAHRPNLIDFGRELDGDEEVHSLENDPRTETVKEEMGFRKGDYIIPKRRYSAFFGTDFETLLRALQIDTLLLCGGLTDVCVHYTFVDVHQSDYFCRMVEDCEGGSSVEAHEAALKAMEYLQTGAVQGRTSTIEAMSSYEHKDYCAGLSSVHWSCRPFAAMRQARRYGLAVVVRTGRPKSAIRGHRIRSDRRSHLLPLDRLFLHTCPKAAIYLS